MLPKSIYMKLSKREKNNFKSNLARTKGSGAYIYDKSQPFGHYGEKIGKYLGAYYGGAPGSMIGRKIGAIGGHLIGRAFGSGAYNIRSGYRPRRIPKYRGTHKMIRGSGAYDIPDCGEVLTAGTTPPSFGNNRTIVRHREFIGNVLSSTTFTLNKYNVNPGDETTFPWLSSIAQNYQKYRPIGCLFEFKSTSGNALNSTNTALGTLMQGINYNAINALEPVSKMEMLQLEGCISICPAQSAMCAVECAKEYNPLNTLYVRNGADFVVPNGAEQFYDFADYYIATEGMQAANVTIGELWVTYEIELLTPILNGGQIGNSINYAQYTLGSGCSTSAYFSGASSALNISNMTLTFTGTTITMPSSISTGCYLLIYYVRGTSASIVTPTVSYTTNCKATNIVVGNTIPYMIDTGTVDRILYCNAFQVTGPSAVLTFSGATFPSSVSGGDLYIIQLTGELIL